MIYKEFGKTGKRLSVLGFGGMRFEASDYTTEAGREKCAEILVKANEKGINYFDTAPGYCGTFGETIFGLAFPQMKKEFYSSTKTKYSDDPTADDVRHRIEQSLKKMNLDKINFYHMWCIMGWEQYEKIMRKGGPYEGAFKAKEEGLIDHICFSTHADGEIIERIIEDDCFEGVTLGYNVLNAPFRVKGIQAAHKKGIGVITMNTLGGGVIPNHADDFKDLMQVGDLSINDTALRYNACHEEINVVLSGMVTDKEVLENIRAFDDFDLNIEYVNKVNEKRKLIINDICTGCNYCSGCPNKLEINKLMLSYNEYIFSGRNSKKLIHDLFHKWGYNEDTMYNCIECGRCERLCTQHLSIISRIKEINSVICDNKGYVLEILNEIFEKGTGINIGIYGIGALARELYMKYLFCFDDYENVFLFDKDKNKQGTFPLFERWEVKNPSDINNYKLDKIVICNSLHYDEIVEELQQRIGYEVEYIKFEMSV